MSEGCLKYVPPVRRVSSVRMRGINSARQAGWITFANVRAVRVSLRTCEQKVSADVRRKCAAAWAITRVLLRKCASSRSNYCISIHLARRLEAAGPRVFTVWPSVCTYAISINIYSAMFCRSGWTCGFCFPSRRAFALACSGRWRCERVKRSQNSERLRMHIHRLTTCTRCGGGLLFSFRLCCLGLYLNSENASCVSYN